MCDDALILEKNGLCSFVTNSKFFLRYGFHCYHFCLCLVACHLYFKKLIFLFNSRKAACAWASLASQVCSVERETRLEVKLRLSNTSQR